MKYAWAILGLVSLASASSAVVPNAPGSFAGAGRIGEVISGNMTTNGSAVAVSPTWVMTAAHVGGSKFEQDGVIYNIVQRIDHPTADISLRRIQGTLKSALPLKFNVFPGGLPSGQAFMSGDILTIAGYGWTGTWTSTGFANITDSAGTLRICRNAMDYYIPQVTVDLGGGLFRTSNYIFYDLDDPTGASGPNIFGGGAVGSDEGGMSLNDSGCPWTVVESGRHKVVGIGGIIGVFSGTGVVRALNWGGYGGACILQGYESWFLPLISDLNTAIVTGVSLELGMNTGGNIASLAESDNVRYTTRTDTTLVDSDTQLGLIVNTTSTKNAGNLKITIEGRTSAGFSHMQVRLWNWSTNSYVNVGNANVSNVENTFVFSGIGSGPYLNAQGQSRVNIRLNPSTEDQRLYDGFFDLIRVEVQ